MNNAEPKRLINDRYLGEAQLLTTGAEDNLLKLAEMRGALTEPQQQRWQQIKHNFMCNKSMVSNRAVAQLSNLVENIQAYINNEIPSNE